MDIIDIILFSVVGLLTSLLLDLALVAVLVIMVKRSMAKKTQSQKVAAALRAGASIAANIADLIEALDTVEVEAVLTTTTPSPQSSPPVVSEDAGNDKGPNL